MANIKIENNPAKVPSEKLAEFIVSDTIKYEKGNRAVISEYSEIMKGVKGYAITQEVVKNMFGANGTIDARVLEMRPRQVNVQTMLVQSEIIRRLEFFSRPIVGECVE